jgi:DNA-binding transcriptional regulator YhcF (GntR family)
MLAFVPVHFAVYRPLKPRLRWAMQCLVGFANHAGRCFPSLRTFAMQAGISKSAAGRDLAELEAEGHLTRTRRPGGVYVYRIAHRFLPQWAREQVSQARDRQRKVGHARRAEASLRGVPQPGTEEKPEKKNQREGARARQRFAEHKVSFGELPDDRAKWQARLRSWRQSRFWLPLWGPKPTEPGCFAPLEVLQAIQRSG